MTQSMDQVACIMLPEPKREVSDNSSHSQPNPLLGGVGVAPRNALPGFSAYSSEQQKEFSILLGLSKELGGGLMP